jgi:putative adhesin
MRPFVLTGVMLVTCSWVAGCTVTLDSQSQIVRDEKRFTVKGIPTVQLTTFDGTIQVQSWDKADVLVEIEKRGPTREAVDAIVVKSSQDGDTIEIEVVRPRAGFGFGVRVSGSARFNVWLPRESHLKARSGDGSILVEHVKGKIDLHTGDGGIRINDASGDLTLNTGDGSVTAEDVQGRLVVDTGDGALTLSGNVSGLRVHTGDGSIIYRAQGATSMSEDWDISTGDGGVLLYLPEDFSAELDAHTGDGGIRNDLNVATSGSGEVNRRTIRGRIGEGGHQLRIRTGDGAIRLKKLEN